MSFFSRDEYLEKLRKVKKNSIILSMIAHDLSNRSMPIKTNTLDLLENINELDSEEIKEILNEMNTIIDDIGNIIEAIRDYVQDLDEYDA